jgi:hypothetical protein
MQVAQEIDFSKYYFVTQILPFRTEEFTTSVFGSFAA